MKFIPPILVLENLNHRYRIDSIFASGFTIRIVQQNIKLAKKPAFLTALNQQIKIIFDLN